MHKFMRMIVFFDLPVQTPKQRSDATHFRNFLLKDGYYMLQYSVYVRICNGMDAVNTHKARLMTQVPDDGSIRLMVVTEKQYESIELILGEYTGGDQQQPNDVTVI